MQLDKNEIKHPGGARCPAPCSKRRFNTRKEARLCASRIQGHRRRMRAYRCESHPQFWHLTSQPAERVALYRDYYRPAEQTA